ncbi:ARL14 effector protein-like isoform X2 [Prorops nasuta]|uniref:ARL14 effector protein-like isoform X2 n=1 Tax=Prorops nasuta TaxID=863751 RepID=UPI0034CF9878
MEGSKNSTNNSSAKNTESGNRPGRPRGSKEKGQKKQSSVDKLGQKFLKNFNPEQSEREKRKLNRRLNQGVKKIIVHDDIGTYVQTGDNFCDCLSFDCEGCHFPCPKCLSTKCGHECRVFSLI